MIIIDGEEIKNIGSFFEEGIEAFYLTNTLQLYRSPPMSVEKDSLSNLKVLYLFGNQLTSFFAEKGCLPNLKCLDLSDNQLNSFSIEKDSLPNLKILYLSNNKLTSFSVEKGSLSNLTSLSLGDNRLTSFSVEKDSFPNLKILYLSDNQLTSFSVEKDSLPNLEKLSLSHNKLTSFSVEKDSLPNLRELGLNNNLDFKVLNFSSISLEYLYIGNTGIQFVDGTLINKVQDKKVKVRKHAIGSLELIIDAFHQDNPIIGELLEHLTL